MPDRLRGCLVTGPRLDAVDAGRALLELAGGGLLGVVVGVIVGAVGVVLLARAGRKRGT